MTSTSARLLRWTPRTLALGLSAFLGLFALDAFSETTPGEAVLAFAVHLMPALVLLVLVALSWRREWLGAVGFAALAAVYAGMVGRNHPDWVLVISGPLLVVGTLYLWAWRRGRAPRQAASGRG